MLRYIVEPVKLDKDHMVWPGQTVFKLRDLKENYLTKNCYTVESTAQKVADKKNGV